METDEVRNELVGVSDIEVVVDIQAFKRVIVDIAVDQDYIVRAIRETVRGAVFNFVQCTDATA